MKAYVGWELCPLLHNRIQNTNFIYSRRSDKLTLAMHSYQPRCKGYLNVPLDQAGLIPESKCGFRTESGIIHIILTARQLQEKCQEQNVDIYVTFVDLTKALKDCDAVPLSDKALMASYSN